MIFCLVILLEEVDVKILPNAVYLILRLLDLCTCNNRTVQAHGYTILHTYRSISTGTGWRGEDLWRDSLMS
ncbi:uncharacterized protein LOC105692665 isoform X4 [Athalia rosae]|uniref:uncharacterized protein LOC105692665 isoform X4 n=1 Tax=Athalia rosae TaxID=37344 RepID=UPI0020347C1C|nr:uncharacterized protein LOC105692665 isoform X4 [Athalia rosae]